MDLNIDIQNKTITVRKNWLYMKILFLHQNFPGQFKHLAQALKSQHQVLAIACSTDRGIVQQEWLDIPVHYYHPSQGSTAGVHPWAADFETKLIRAQGAFLKAQELKAQGFTPDIIVAHPGWGESIFMKQVWPTAKLGLYGEFYYQSAGGDVNFDHEFIDSDPSLVCRIALKNTVNNLHFHEADGVISPTNWQASTYPEAIQQKISVIHDGIDTDLLKPNPDAFISLKSGDEILKFTRNDEIITFVNRNLEPYRGYHIFMRSLPAILAARPKAHVFIIGGDGASYGGMPSSGTWKEKFFEEVKDRIDTTRVHFFGSLEYAKYITVMQLSKVHVYLTYPFVLSWSLLEAMSMGACVIASDTAPLQEVIIDNMTGRLVNFFDHKALANSVIQLLHYPEHAKIIGENARNFVIDHYDLQRVCLPRQLTWIEHLAKK